MYDELGDDAFSVGGDAWADDLCPHEMPFEHTRKRPVWGWPVHPPGQPGGSERFRHARRRSDYQ